MSHTLQQAYDSARETYIGVRWIYQELISDTGRINAKRALGLLLLNVFTLMAVPYTIKELVDAHIAGDTDGAMWWLGASVGINILAIGLGILHDHFRERGWNSNFFNLHTRVMAKQNQRPLEEIISEKSEIGPEQVESLKDKAQNILYLFLFESSIVLATIINATIFTFFLDSAAGLVMVGLTIFNLGWFFYFNTTIDSKMTSIDEAFRRATRRAVEKLNFVHSVKAHGVEDKVVVQTGDELREPLAEDFAIWGWWFLGVEVTRRCINGLVPPALIGYGLLYANWTAGEISAIFTWTFLISREYGFIGHLMRHLTSQVARIKAARIALSVPPKFAHNQGAIFKDPAMHVSLQGVHLAYESGPILRNISLEIPPGRRVALIGPSGAGKSTIANLIIRSMDPDQGMVCINDQPYPHYNRTSIMRRMGVILQRPEMISGTVRENILFGVHPVDMLSVTDNDIWHLLQQIAPTLAKKFERESGLETLIGRNGMKLSGGQQQLLCIIRALIKRPKFLVVDEATSSLDAVLQREVQAGIDHVLKQGIPAIVIAHRLSTLQNCNYFVVLRPLASCAAGESQIEATASSMQELHDRSPTFRAFASEEGIVF